VKSIKWFFLSSILVIAIAVLLPREGVSSGWLDEGVIDHGIIDHPQLEPGSWPDDLPTDQIIIQYRDINMAQLSVGERIDAMDRLSQTAGVELAYVRPMSGDAHVLKLPNAMPDSQVEAIAANLQALPDVAYAEPDSLLFPMDEGDHPEDFLALPVDDTFYSAQWHFFSPSSGDYGVDAPAAWGIITGTADVVVAVIDTGITDHPDLAARYLAGYDFIDDVPTANDGDGRDPDPSDSGDWITTAEANQAGGPFEGCPVVNSSWHGTHVAGTIGAATNNNLGVAGINWNAMILPVRVLGKCGGYTSDIADGMRWAAGIPVAGVPDNTSPAKVLNMSLGGKKACGSTYQSAVDAVLAKGSVIVVSAGNSYENVADYRPANCNGVISVGATNRAGEMAYYSNFGSTVKISAPGGETYAYSSNGVLSTINTGITQTVASGYAFYQGTSMAAPHVSGVASLLYSLNPNINPTQVLAVLQGTVTSFPTVASCPLMTGRPANWCQCTTSLCGSGIVNAGDAVAILPRLEQVSPITITDSTQPVTLTISGANFNTSSQITWNGAAHTTTLVNSTQLTTVLAPSDLSVDGNYPVSVVGTYAPYGQLTTVSKIVKVGEPNFVYLPIIVNNYRGGWETIFSDGFEGSFPGMWAVTDPGGTGYTWGVSTCSAWAGGRSAWVLGSASPACGTNYVDNMNSWMVYGPFDLSDATQAYASLKLLRNTEDVFDNVCVMASSDGVNFNGTCYYGFSGGWEKVELDFGAVPTSGSMLGDSSVWLGFQFKSSYGSERPNGAFIDDVVIEKCLTGICSERPTLLLPFQFEATDVRK